MKKRVFALAAALLTATTSLVSAQETCGGEYRVKSGDSLSLIADSMYKDVGHWTTIHSANFDKIGPNPNSIRVGMKLRLSCINGLPTGLKGGVPIVEAKAAAAAPAAPIKQVPGNAATRQKINILTGSDFAPFTDENLPNGGILADVVQHAMEAAAPEQGFAVHWVNDWGAHHEPLLSNALLDIGFPWFKPDCEADPTTYRCANLDFSDSMFEVLMLLFVSKDRAFGFAKDEDIYGKNLCRPEGYSTFMFDHKGRNWLMDGKITLTRAPSPGDCLEMLVDGEVDGVVLNEFTGREKISELGFKDKVQVALGQPISIDGNHMVVHKSHPNGAELLEVFEEGLKTIKENGTYQRIIDEHMTRIWSEY
jgi:polar amino acid transport system substrate-binding protein